MIYTSVLIFLISSCMSRNENSEHIEAILGSELKLKGEYVEYFEGKEKIRENLHSSKAKLITYFDVYECSSCLEDLLLWSEFINSNKLSNVDILVVLCVDRKYFDTIVRKILPAWDVTYPLIIDTKGFFAKNNSIDKKKFFRTFLTNKNNIVEITGNPLHSEDLKSIYIEKINSYN